MAGQISSLRVSEQTGAHRVNAPCALSIWKDELPTAFNKHWEKIVIPGICADIVLLVHFAFIIFALLGGFIVLWKRRAAWFHIPTVLWSSVVNLASWVCPLTPIENWFRAKAGQAGYGGGFIQHYIEPLVYPGGMPRDMELIAAISVLAWNAVVYTIIVIMWRRRKA
jgi:hypothetical protein